MAGRSLEDLQRQYNQVAKDQRGGMMGGPGRGPGRNGRGPGGKPKNSSVTIKRLWGYVAKYKLRLVLVLLCMILSTVASLLGSFMLSPIINRITREIAPNLAIEYTPIGRVVDRLIIKICNLQ